MSIDRIPTSTEIAYYEFEIELDGTEFKLEFRFNDRDSAWYLTIKDTDDAVLRAGLKLVNSSALLSTWVEDTKPKGELMTISQGKVLRPATIEQLGQEVVLVYLDEQEVAEIG